MLSDHYEYVMHGKIFKYKSTKQVRSRLRFRGGYAHDALRGPGVLQCLCVANDDFRVWPSLSAYCRCCDRRRWGGGLQGGQPKVEVTISFGGLLLQLVGDPTKLEVLELDTFIFLLMRKV